MIIHRLERNHTTKTRIRRISGVLEKLPSRQWDDFALWLLSGDGPLANVNPLPSCLAGVVKLYEGRLVRERHNAQAWLDVSYCLSDICLGRRHSFSCDQKSRRRRIAGRYAASAAASAAFVYGAFDYNPQRERSPSRLVMPKVQAVTDACWASAWTSAPERYKHRRDDNFVVALEDCRIELENMSGLVHVGSSFFSCAHGASTLV